MADEQQQTEEVRQTNEQLGDTNVQRQTVTRSDKVPRNVLWQRIVYYVGGIIMAFEAVRFILQLLAAHQGNWFVDFVYAVSGWFATPFYGIFGEPTYGASQFDSSALVAFIVYGILTVIIAKLFTLNSNHPEA